MRGSVFISEFFLLILLSGLSLAQPNITKMEYFIDADPGIGLATDIALSAAPNLNIGIKVPTSSLSIGFHLLSIRAQDQNGVWSMFENKAFFITTSSTTSQNDITKIEYFIDTDPGIGNGIAVPITAATNFNFIEKIPTTTLTEGFHLLTIRAQDEEGNWSLRENNAFFVDKSRQIIAYEYAIDLDPGIGLALNQPIIPSQDSIDQVLKVDTNPLALGGHNVYLRIQDSNLFWSKTQVIPFSVCDGANASFAATTVCLGSVTNFTDGSLNVLAGDIYSWDFDGDGFEDSNTVGDQSFTYASSGTKMATLTIDRLGCVGTQTVTILVEPIAMADAGTDQAICTTSATLAANLLSANEIGVWLITKGTAVITDVNDPLSSLTAIATDSIELSWTVTNSVAGCSATDNILITSSGILNASISAASVCLGNPTLFTDNSVNVYPTDVYNWDYEGDAIIDETNSGDQSFTYSSPGTYNATLNIDRGGCISSTTIIVEVFDTPLADAGIDQSVCTQSTTLAGSIPGANEVGTWQLINGNGTISSLNDPISTLNNITSGTIELTWTLNNTLTGCNSIDSVLISSNQPITAVAVNRVIDIGQSITIDVQSLATSSPGDILTTTIITPPQFGVDSIGSDGSINYTPNPDAAANDFLVYRITNQCNNFGEAQINFTVLNLPPEIDSTSTNTSTNSTEAIIDLNSLVSDPNNNIDLNSISITSQPTSKAVASIDANLILTIDYRGITYSGDDQLSIQVCDLLGVCTTGIITIPNVEVGGVNPPITVFNGVSPDDDGFNDFLEIENIEFYPQNVVRILNRWGDEIAKYQGYNNQNIVFKDATLPSGTYYYHIVSGVEEVQAVTGHFILKID